MQRFALVPYEHKTGFMSLPVTFFWILSSFFSSKITLCASSSAPLQRIYNRIYYAFLDFKLLHHI
jgi:hypothetical protein